MSEQLAQQPNSDERLRALADAWLEEHDGKPVRMDVAAVQEITARLIRSRLHPTVESIRAVNAGKGSPNVIHPALKAFFTSGEIERRELLPAPAPGVPKVLVDAWSRALVQTRLDARAELDGERSAVAKAMAEIKAQRKEVASAVGAAAERAAAQEAMIARLQREVEKAEAATARAEKERTKEREVLQQRLDEAREELKQSVGDFKRQSTEKQALQSMADKLHISLDHSERQAKALIKEVELLRRKLDRSDEQLADAKAALAKSKGEIDAAKAEGARVRKSLSEKQREAWMLEEKLRATAKEKQQPKRRKLVKKVVRKRSRT